MSQEDIEVVKASRQSEFRSLEDQTLQDTVPLAEIIKFLAETYPNDPRFGQARQIMDKLERINTAIENAETVEEIYDIDWNTF